MGEMPSLPRANLKYQPENPIQVRMGVQEVYFLGQIF
jgi:hypothetical protein